MKSIKLFFIGVLFIVIACKKQSTTPSINIGTCTPIQAETFLIGKWKMISWSSAHNNLSTCEHIGGSGYNCEDYNINVLIEVTSNGIVKTYKDDNLVNESILTKVSTSLSQVSYETGCGDIPFDFWCLSITTDVIANIGVGDTLRINNPFVNINFSNGPIRSVTSGYPFPNYVKIE